MGKTWALRAKANLLLLRAEPDDALQTLQLAFEAPDYQQWWYTLERDSLWAPVRQDPRFLAIAAGVRTHVKSEVGELRALQRAALCRLWTPQRCERRWHACPASNFAWVSCVA